jgi:predicted flap endonuclease-1-like 5' DNA nuclease
MTFSANEREQLLALKGVGETVVQRLESIGINTFERLSQANAAEVTLAIAKMMGSTCWHNSSQARAAVQAMIDCSRKVLP